jgi:cytochrome bd-type quinol oxidase subunit 1
MIRVVIYNRVVGVEMGWLVRTMDHGPWSIVHRPVHNSVVAVVYIVCVYLMLLVVLGKFVVCMALLNRLVMYLTDWSEKG